MNSIEVGTAGIEAASDEKFVDNPVFLIDNNS